MKKLNLALPLLAVLFAVVGAVASTGNNQFTPTTPDHYRPVPDEPCVECNPVDSPSNCTTSFTLNGRCECTIEEAGQPQTKQATNDNPELCEALYKINP